VGAQDQQGTAGTEEGFRGPQVCSIVGITYRQLDYWARTNLIRPSIVDAAGSGSKRRYSYADLLELKVIKSLLDAGVALQSARKALEYLRENLGEDVATANLVLNGSGSVLARTGEEIVDLLRSGQGVLNIVPLAGCRDQVDAAILELPLGDRPRSGAGASTPDQAASTPGTGAATG
jgi:DNA-binding transcriptional MerR regulator